MTKFKSVTAILLASAALAACGGSGSSGAREQIRAVGSSTVYPFSTAVAEAFIKSQTGFKSPIIESTGTGAGMKLFCAGVGVQHPDMENASRRIKKSEYAECAKNGVKDIVEIQVGIDGIAFAEATSGPGIALTPLDVYKALADTPFGKPNTTKTWKDVNPAFPALPITVYGPPKTSGTRDALAELILEKGCDTDPAMKALKETNKDEHKKICTGVRTDGVYVEQGENDNLIVQKRLQPQCDRHFRFQFPRRKYGQAEGHRHVWHRADLCHDLGLQLSWRPPALHIHKGRALEIDPRPQGVRSGICFGLGSGRLSQKKGNGRCARRSACPECRDCEDHGVARSFDPEIVRQGQTTPRGHACHHRS